MDILEKYEEVIEKLNLATTEPNKFAYSVIKFHYEIELGCLKKANTTFEEILNFNEPVMMSWSILVRNSFLTGKIEKLYEASVKKWRINLSLLDKKNDYNSLFLIYCNYKKHNKLEKQQLELFTKKEKVRDEIKSIVCFLLGLSVETDVERIEYLQMAQRSCSKNYSALLELMKFGMISKNYDIRNLLCSDIEHLKELKYIPSRNLKNNTSTKDTSNLSQHEFEICVLGGGNTIGGSCYLIKFNGFNILVDAGAKFGNRDELIYPNFSKIEDFDLKGLDDIDMLLLTHAHLDHAGGIVEFYKKKPELPMYMTQATKELVHKNLNFSNSENSDTNQYYLEKCLKSAVSIDFRQPFKFKKDDKFLKIEFFRAGHILGASSIYLESNNKSIFITGDYCLDDQKTVKGMDLPNGYIIDILITENTYGKSRKNNAYPRYMEEQLFIRNIIENLKNKKRALIPAFALGRSQEIICLMKEYLQKQSYIPFRVYIDGLVIDICKIYSKYIEENFKGRGLFFVKHNQGYSSKKSFIEDELMHHKCCIISSSGMIKDGSTSSYYAEKLITDKNSMCVLTGYQDEETIGGKLKRLKNVESNKYLEINGNMYNVNFDIAEYYLSAHCQFEDIIEMVFKTRPRHVFLVHGNATENENSEIYEQLSMVENLNVIQTFDNVSYKVKI